MVMISLVTGASSGLGKEIAKQLSEKGHRVYVTARHSNELLKLKQECKKFKGEIKPIVGDLTDTKFREKLITTILTNEKKIDYLINNAGYGKEILLEKQELKDIENMFNINVFAYAHLIQLVLPSMKKRHKGKIINISSVVGFLILPFFTIYSATKHAINGLTKGLDIELKGTGVSVTAVCPARMKTNFAANAFDCTKNKKDCVKQFNSSANSPEGIARFVVKNLDTKKLFIYPTLKARILVWLSMHCSCLVRFISKYILGSIERKKL